MSAPQTTPTPQIDVLFAEYAKNIEGFVEFGRQAIERATRQNNELAEAWKNGVTVAKDALQQLTKAQRELVTAGADRVQVVSDLAAANVESIKKTVAAVSATFDNLGGGVGTAVQRQVKEVAAAQKTALEQATRQLEESGNAALEAFQRGVDAVVEARKVTTKSRTTV